MLLVGAGKMSELAARHLIQQGATSILVANRTQEKAALIAGQIADQISMQIANNPQAIGCTTEVIPFEQLHDQAGRADIVITSTGAEGHLFTRAHGQRFLERRRNRPMFFIDIAVPRDVDPGVNDVEGCFVYDIDDLQQVAAAHLARPTAVASPPPPRTSSPRRWRNTTSTCNRATPSPPSSLCSSRPRRCARPN